MAAATAPSSCASPHSGHTCARQVFSLHSRQREPSFVQLRPRKICESCVFKMQPVLNFSGLSKPYFPSTSFTLPHKTYTTQKLLSSELWQYWKLVFWGSAMPSWVSFRSVLHRSFARHSPQEPNSAVQCWLKASRTPTWITPLHGPGAVC